MQCLSSACNLVCCALSFASARLRYFSYMCRSLGSFRTIFVGIFTLQLAVNSHRAYSLIDNMLETYIQLFFDCVSTIRRWRLLHARTVVLPSTWFYPWSSCGVARSGKRLRVRLAPVNESCHVSNVSPVVDETKVTCSWKATKPCTRAAAGFYTLKRQVASRAC